MVIYVIMNIICSKHIYLASAVFIAIAWGERLPSHFLKLLLLFFTSTYEFET